MNRTVLITGANAGLGKESARQLALLESTEKIYLACRNEAKAIAAKKELEESTGRNIFEIVIMDVSSLKSVKNAISTLNEPVDALIMNAGGLGGKTPSKVSSHGVTDIFATNVLGHVALLEELLEKDLLKDVAVFAGTEAARGVPKMGIKRPNLKTSSVHEFASIADGSFFGTEAKGMEAYGPVKYMAIMNLMATARKHPNVRIVSMSPGGTSGTDAAKHLKGFMKVMFTTMATTLMPLMGMMHKLEVGAKRFVDAVIDPKYKSGVFYASKAKITTGNVIDQATIFPDLANTQYQENAYRAVHQFVK